MADDATMTISAVILPDEISKTLESQTYGYTPADATEGWYYKMVDVTTSSGNLIGTETFLQKGAAAAGVDVGSAMPAISTSDKVKFLFIKHTGYRDDGTTANTADSVFLVFDGGSAAHGAADAVEVGPSECWFGKFNGLTVGNLNCISAQKAAAGSGGNKIQCFVAAVIDDVA
jgi:hypothetical protein